MESFTELYGKKERVKETIEIKINNIKTILNVNNAKEIY